MPIKWGSTTCTVIKWGSTTCSAVYWGSTLVYPGSSGKVVYNGSSFSSPLTGIQSVNNTGGIYWCTSGALYIQVPKTSTDYELGRSITTWDTNNAYTVNMSSYTTVSIEYTSTNANALYITGIGMNQLGASGTYSATAIVNVKGSLYIGDISGVSSRSSTKFTINSIRLKGYNTGTHTITIKKIIFG